MSKPKLTPQQRALVKHLLAGKTITDSARLAGYADNGYVGQMGSQALEAIRRKMPEVLDAHGLTDEVLIEKYLKPLMNAEETEFAKFEGKITDERNVIAWEPRKSGLDMAFNLKGSYAASQSNGPANGSHITVNVLMMAEAPNLKSNVINEVETDDK
jgi:hypothetical protein